MQGKAQSHSFIILLNGALFTYLSDLLHDLRFAWNTSYLSASRLIISILGVIQQNITDSMDVQDNNTLLIEEQQQESQDAMESIDFCTFGMFIIGRSYCDQSYPSSIVTEPLTDTLFLPDEIEYLPPKPAVRGILGGAVCCIPHNPFSIHEFSY